MILCYLQQKSIFSCK